MKKRIGGRRFLPSGDMFEGSFVMRFSKKIYNMLFSGFFGSIMTGYSALQRKFASGAVAKTFGSSDRAGDSWERNPLSRARRAVISGVEDSILLKAVSRGLHSLLSVYLRVYGFFLLYLGISMAVMNVIKRAALMGDFSLWDFAVSCVLICASFPMLVSKQTLGAAIDSSVVMRTVTYGLLGFTPRELKAVSEHTSERAGYFRGALAGALIGCLALFISPILVCIGLAGAVAAVLVFIRPEIGLLGMVLICPVLSLAGSPTLLLSALVIYTVLCTLVKIFLGRISMSVEIADVFVLIFMVAVGMGGVISVGASLKSGLMYVCLMGVYFLTVLLVRTRELLQRLQIAFVTSGVIVSLAGFYQLATGNLEAETLDAAVFGGISGRITSTFGNANMAGVFLVMVFPFAMALLFGARSGGLRAYGFFACMMMGVCTLLTWSRGAWLGLIFAAIVFVALYSHTIIPLLIPAGALSLTLLWDKLGGSGLFLNLLSRFTSIFTVGDTSSAYRLSIWKGTLNIIEENWLTGIGIGSDAFARVYIKFAESGAEYAMHSHNMFLQISAELGVPALVVFLICVFLCTQSGLELIRFGGPRQRGERAVCVAAISAATGALMQGLTDHIWFNYRVFFTFWLVLAMIRVAATIGRKYGNSRFDD